MSHYHYSLRRRRARRRHLRRRSPRNARRRRPRRDPPRLARPSGAALPRPENDRRAAHGVHPPVRRIGVQPRQADRETIRGRNPDIRPPQRNPAGNLGDLEHSGKGQPIGGLGDGEAFWHTNSSFVDVPPAASLLRCLECPPPSAGGATYFLNMYSAYETLPADIKTADRRDDRDPCRDAQQRRQGA